MFLKSPFVLNTRPLVLNRWFRHQLVPLKTGPPVDDGRLFLSCFFLLNNRARACVCSVTKMGILNIRNGRESACLRYSCAQQQQPPWPLRALMDDKGFGVVFKRRTGLFQSLHHRLCHGRRLFCFSLKKNGHDQRGEVGRYYSPPVPVISRS